MIDQTRFHIHAETFGEIRLKTSGSAQRPHQRLDGKAYANIIALPYTSQSLGCDRLAGHTFLNHVTASKVEGEPSGVVQRGRQVQRHADVAQSLLGLRQCLSHLSRESVYNNRLLENFSRPYFVNKTVHSPLNTEVLKCRKLYAC